MAAKTLQDAINAIQDEIGKITTVRLAPDYAPDNISVWPAIITYASSGEAITGDFGLSEYHHNVTSEVHIPRKDLSRDLAALMPFIEKVCEELTIGDTVLGAIIESFDRITYQVAPSRYADTDTMCIRFVLHNILMFPYGKK